MCIRDSRKDLKSGGRLGNIVGVAHPADALFGDVLKELSSVQNADLPFSVLARRRMSDFAAQRIGNQLTACLLYTSIDAPALFIIF